MVDGLIFSKDRPAQLRLLLDSLQAHAPGLYSSLAVIWDASSDDYARAYDECFQEGSPCLLISKRETAGSFRRDMLDWLESAGDRVGFLVDDLVFYRNIPDGMFDSYRLGWNCDFCYPAGALQRKPTTIVPGRLIWDWREIDGDFGYPISLDAHTFSKTELAPLLDGLEFVDPNTLEHGLSQRAALYDPAVLSCPPLSCAVSIPANLVNRSVANRHGDDPAETPAALLARWQDGDRLDLAAMDFSDVRGCHQEIPLVWKDVEP